MPLACTEWGYSTGTTTGTAEVSNAQVQADYLAHMYLVNASQGILFTTAYEWKDTGSDPKDYESNFGMLTADGQPKAAYQEMQLLTTSLRGETFTTKLNDSHSTDWLLVFTSPSGQQTLAAWTTRSGGRTNVVVPGWGTYNLTSTPFYVNPSTVPEPHTLTLLIIGSLGLMVYTWRRSSAKGKTRRAECRM